MLIRKYIVRRVGNNSYLLEQKVERKPIDFECHRQIGNNYDSCIIDSNNEKAINIA